MRTQLPPPEFVTAKTDWGMAYGWRCEAHGVLAFGDTKVEALANWKRAYTEETGLAVVEPAQTELFAN